MTANLAKLNDLLSQLNELLIEMPNFKVNSCFDCKLVKHTGLYYMKTSKEHGNERLFCSRCIETCEGCMKLYRREFADEHVDCNEYLED